MKRGKRSGSVWMSCSSIKVEDESWEGGVGLFLNPNRALEVFGLFERRGCRDTLGMCKHSWGMV